MRAWLLAVGALGLATGCGFDGDATFGEENRSTWRIDDGLCPGVEGGCGMETPVAAGVAVSVDAEVPCAAPRRSSSGSTRTDCRLTALEVGVGGPVTLLRTDYDVDDGRIDIEVATTAEGTASLELSEADGRRFDRVTFDVREAADLECGQVGAGGAAWDMPGLVRNESFFVSSSGADRQSALELGCRLVDARGAPLFSAAAISWRIVEGPDSASIDDGGLFGEASASGARIYVRFSEPGTIRLAARFGDFARELTVVVE